MGHENSPEGRKRTERIGQIVGQIEDRYFETQDLLIARRLEQARAKLREIDRLIKELESYNVQIDLEFQRKLNNFRDVVFRRKTFEEAFGIKITQAGCPETYAEDWKVNEKAIISFANTKLRGKTFATVEKIKGAMASIEAFITELKSNSKESGFVVWVRQSLYAELYKAIKERFKGRLSQEMEQVVGQVLDRALVIGEGGDGGGKSEETVEESAFGRQEVDRPADEGGGASGDEEVPVDGKPEAGDKPEERPEGIPVPVIDPLFVYPKRLAEKFKLPEGVMPELLTSAEMIIGEDFLESIEEEALPQDFLDDLHEIWEDLGSKLAIANPWQEALLNLFAVYVIKPIYAAIKEKADFAVVRYPVRKILLDVRRNIAIIFATPRASLEVVTAVLNRIRVATAGLVDVGLKVFLDSKFEGAADMIIEMVKTIEQNDSAGQLTAIIRRDPRYVAEQRSKNPDKITRLSALTYLLLRLKEEHKDNKAFLIGLQFAIQVLIRLRDDSELLSVAPVIKQTVKNLLLRYGGALTEVPFLSVVGEEELDTVLGFILPDPEMVSGEGEDVQAARSEKDSLNYRKVETFLLLIEDLLAKDPEKYSKYNAVLVCLIENIRQYMHRKDAKERLLKDFAVLQGLVRKIAGEQNLRDPFVQLVLDHPELISGAVAAFYMEPKGATGAEGAGDVVEAGAGKHQLMRLKTVLSEIAKENAGNKHVEISLRLAVMILEGFENDKEFFANIARFEPVLDKVFFGEEFVGLQLSGEARATLKSIIGYAPIVRHEPDMAMVRQIADVFGDFDEVSARPAAEMRQRIVTLITEVPAVLKLNYALAGFGEGLKFMAGKIAGEKFGVKERALFDFIFANYRDYLCDKYDNDIEKFLLEIKKGQPPEVTVKTENIEREAMMFVQIGGAALVKIGASKVAVLIRKNLILLANVMKERLLQRRQTA